MASLGSLTDKKLSPPTVPKTPSDSINKVLRDRCGKSHDNPIKLVLSHVVCKLFLLITQVYNMIHKDERTASHQHWMMASGAVSAVIFVGALVFYNVLTASAFILEFLLYYFCVGAVLIGVGVCVSGVLFFDKKSTSSDVGETVKQAASDIANKVK